MVLGLVRTLPASAGNERPPEPIMCCVAVRGGVFPPMSGRRIGMLFCRLNEKVTSALDCAGRPRRVGGNPWLFYLLQPREREIF